MIELFQTPGPTVNWCSGPIYVKRLRRKKPPIKHLNRQRMNPLVILNVGKAAAATGSQNRHQGGHPPQRFLLDWIRIAMGKYRPRN